jgi:hypothetical protein
MRHTTKPRAVSIFAALLLCGQVGLGCGGGSSAPPPYQPQAAPALLPDLQLPSRPSSGALRAALEPRADGALSVSGFLASDALDGKREVRVAGVVRALTPDCLITDPPPKLSAQQRKVWKPYRTFDCKESLAILISDAAHGAAELTIQGYNADLHPFIKLGTGVLAVGHFTPDTGTFTVPVDRLWVTDKAVTSNDPAVIQAARDALEAPPPP